LRTGIGGWYTCASRIGEQGKGLMAGWTNRFAGAHRNARTLLALALIATVLAFGLLMRSGEVVETAQEIGTVMEVTETRRAQGSVYLARVAVGGGDEIQVPLNAGPPRPVEGARIPLIVETDRNGERRYRFDQHRWMFSGRNL
jgi:hypothetical protein